MPDRLETSLAAQLAPQGGFEPAELEIACPEDEPIKKDHRFDCTLTKPDGKTAPVHVVLTDDSGHFQAVVPPGNGFGPSVVLDYVLETELAKQLAPQAGVKPADVKVDCPPDQPARKGHRFRCTLTAPNGDKVPVKVRLTDNKGGFDARVPR